MVTKESIYYDSRTEERKIHALKWQPEGKVRAIFIIAHGMAEYMDRYDAFATYLAERGVLVAGCDYLGHGWSVGGQAQYGYFCQRDPATVIVRDVHRLKKMFEQEYPGTAQIVMGHSMGSFVVRNYLCRYGAGVDAAILMGTGMPPRLLIMAARLLAGLQALFLGGDKPGTFLNKMTFGGYNKRVKEPESFFSWLSFDGENVRAYDRDPLCGFVFTVNGFQALFALIDRVYKPDSLAKIPARLPVLIVSGREDPVGGYGQGVRRTKTSLQKAGVSDVTMKLYPWGRHEILREAEKMEAYYDIVNWLNEKLELWEAEGDA
ncbi:MAG: lysophospholipase [Lachnospiraceae bacterium]|jgi:alpha-beta hydrolase superfamily lysophospholipase|nr:lysophospholipase [Lachnospiraceae bacterium]